MGKYYYGSSYKEAISNPPVTIKSDKQLKGYMANYTWVIPVQETLPTEEEMEIDSCLADSIEDDDYVQECINNYLSEKYGYCVEDYSYSIEGDKIKITLISWDTED